MDWTHGYVADTQYTSGFYREMAPLFTTMAGLMLGARVPDDRQPYTYCELGCGQGVGTVVMAAASPHGRFYGIDFNPGQIDNANRLAATGGLDNVSFIEASFTDLLERHLDTLPDFDYITLHGVYSWITPENRAAIVAFIARKLRPGGTVYVSYNTMPGWAAMAPAQRFMSEVAARKSGRSDLRAVAGLDELDRLKEAGSRYFAANPSLAARLTKARTLDKTYVAHEYLNANWHPLYVTDVISEMAAAKLSYLGSASLVENLDTIFFPQSLHATANAFGDPAFSELVKDFYSNKQFRRDIFVRGGNRLGRVDITERMSSLCFALAVSLADIKLTFETIVGEVKGNEAIYRPIVEALDGPPLSFAELAARPGLAMSTGDLFQALYLLVNSNQVVPLYRIEGASLMPAQRFNLAMVEEARRGRVLPFMAIPGSGLGLPLGMNQLFLLCAMGEGLTTADAILPRFLTLLAENNVRLLKDGVTLTDPAASAQEARRQIDEILSKHVPIWERLALLPPAGLGRAS